LWMQQHGSIIRSPKARVIAYLISRLTNLELGAS
jgi:hypothetical protein